MPEYIEQTGLLLWTESHESNGKPQPVDFLAISPLLDILPLRDIIIIEYCFS